MARLSDIIEEFIKELINETNGVIEIQRNELANYFNCVPSQINYVIDTRFTSEKGFLVESRRGGGGHIRIKRVNISRPGSYLMHVINSMGDSLTQQSAEAFIRNFLDYDIITEREANIIGAAISDKALGSIKNPTRDKLRSRVLKNILAGLAASI
jgi:transcriptional regulator CtsR